MTSKPEPDAALLAAHDLARAALSEITPEATIGAPAGYTLEDDGVVSLRFANRLAGYPGWFWTVSVARVEGEEPTVLEVELLPGDGALLAPDWVPWAVRLADYQAAQAAQAESADAEDDDADDADFDDADDADDLDDEDDFDADDDEEDDDLDSDGSSILHAGDVDGVDIDELDDTASDDEPDADEPDADDAASDDELDDAASDDEPDADDEPEADAESADAESEPETDEGR